jgi:processing peptidase subunit alpha
VDHKELLSVAEPLLSDIPSVPHHSEEPYKAPTSAYTGGDFRAMADTAVNFTAFSLTSNLFQYACQNGG